jgi:hypothetical protein
VRRHRRRSPLLGLVAAALLTATALGTGVGLAGTTPAGPGARWQPGCAAHCPATPVALDPAPGRPTRVRVARIGIDSPLTPLGLDPVGALLPPTDFDRAGWYAGGPVPGDPGPAVLAGHLDSRSGPAVFARLGELRPGDRVEVWRTDPGQSRSSRGVFRVTGSLRSAKAHFPTAAVYGPTPVPELRLVTCGGAFDPGTGHYRDNLVVFAVADDLDDPFASPTAQSHRVTSSGVLGLKSWQVSRR